MLHLTEDHVLAIQPGSGDGADEELGSVGILAGVRHGQHPGLVVLQLRLLHIDSYPQSIREVTIRTPDGNSPWYKRTFCIDISLLRQQRETLRQNYGMTGLVLTPVGPP